MIEPYLIATTPVMAAYPDALAEMAELERLISSHPATLRVSLLGQVGPVGNRWPLYALELGNSSPDAPAVGIFGGVHGNERIGSKVALSFLHCLLEQLRWDEQQQALLQTVRVVFMPLVNPTGMALGNRATGSGIDLMRNAPLDSATPHWLAGGQRLSRYLPWYRGRTGVWANEALALVELVRARLLKAPFSLALDCHSGFGMRDRIWFPYAYSREPIPHLAEIYALRNLFRATYPNHSSYRIEPQCLHYMTHGDLWDYLYRESLTDPARIFLPLTLEMGSWLWVRKNPRQVFSRLGLFNPLVPHRRRRILRQHLLWFEFLLRAAASYRNWLPKLEQRDPLDSHARQYWRSHYSVGPARIDDPAKAD